MCFDVLTDKQKNELLNNTVKIDFAAGETIIKRGFVASNIMFIESGIAKLDILTDGHITTVSLIPEKSFIGVVCTFANHHYDFSAVALEKTTISLFDRELFERFIKENGEFACHFIQHMSLITNGLVHHLSRFSHKNIEGALAILLADFSSIYKSTTFTLPVSRIEMANILGYSKESVINTLSKFNKEEIIAVSDRKIVINSLAKLLQIGEIG
jgi:CRP-like cAMP-binding protein